MPIRIVKPSFCVAIAVTAVILLPTQYAHAWKPSMHAGTANVALLDAVDGAICLPGVSAQELPLFPSDLMGIQNSESDRSGEIFNDLKDLGASLRAGAIGPDAFPDFFFGQTAVHVDHSRITPEQASEECEGPCTIIGEELTRLIMTPLRDGTPRFRTIDWGHEILRDARQLHGARLAGHTRAEILANPALKALYAERQSAIAFALGYLMHFAGDSEAHTWINQWVGGPFNMTLGRTTQLEQAPLLGAFSEELQHLMIEGYVSEKYRPTVADASCQALPIDITNASSICDDGPIEFEIECEYCNPLRGAPLDSSELSTKCDHCFSGCNPWREICPPSSHEGRPCAECGENNVDLFRLFVKVGEGHAASARKRVMPLALRMGLMVMKRR